MAEKKCILLVDDDLDFTEATKSILETRFYDVLVAHNGDEGLLLAKEKRPDLILLDIVMPVKDGFTAAEQLKRDPVLKNIPTLMLTAFATKHGEGIPVDRGYVLDVEDYIDKSISAEELLDKVEKQLAGQAG